MPQPTAAEQPGAAIAVESTTEASMKRLGWIVIAAVASTVLGCSTNDPLYTSPKYVPGYTPGASSAKLAQAKEYNPNANWQ